MNYAVQHSVIVPGTTGCDVIQYQSVPGFALSASRLEDGGDTITYSYNHGKLSNFSHVMRMLQCDIVLRELADGDAHTIIAEGCVDDSESLTVNGNPSIGDICKSQTLTSCDQCADSLAPPLESHGTSWLPLALRKNATWYTYGHDLTKNVTELYTTAGAIITEYDYTPYGAVTATGLEQPIQWSSEHYDAELGMVYYNYRHYNPLDGRWINRDPIMEQGGYNLYGFVENAVYAFLDMHGINSV